MGSEQLAAYIQNVARVKLQLLSLTIYMAIRPHLTLFILVIVGFLSPEI